jgi:hypothetical protein
MSILRDGIVTTRKKRKCNACMRVFDKGTKMRTQVNTYHDIVTWRECPTCTELLSKFRQHFEDEYDGLCYEFCVADSLDKGQTPEQLLEELNNKTQ